MMNDGEALAHQFIVPEFIIVDECGRSSITTIIFLIIRHQRIKFNIYILKNNVVHHVCFALKDNRLLVWGKFD